MIVVTVFLSILNQMEFHLVENRKENCHHDHIPLLYTTIHYLFQLSTLKKHVSLLGSNPPLDCSLGPSPYATYDAGLTEMLQEPVEEEVSVCCQRSEGNEGVLAERRFLHAYMGIFNNA